MVAVAPPLHRVAAPRAHVLATAIGYFALVDLLFLPYFQLVIMPFSLPVILVTPIVVGTTTRRDLYFFLFMTLALFVLVSVGISTGLPGHTSFATENVKRAIQLLSSFGYFFYFRWLAERVEFDVTPIILAFTLWFASLGLAFFLLPADTFYFIRDFYGRLVTDESIVAVQLRFAYLFTDPNTAGYFFLVAFSMLLLKQRSVTFLITFFAVALVAVFLTLSKGALLTLILVIGATLYPPKTFMRSLVSVRKWLVLVFVVVAAIAIFYYVSEAATTLKTARVAFNRIFGSSERYLNGSGRFTVWARFLTNVMPLPLGRGYILRVQGAVQGTHSDLLRVVYSYGFLAVPPIVVLLFSRIISLTPLILPALMAFLINSLIDEQKLLALFLSLLAIAGVAADRNGTPAVNAKNV